MVQLFINSEKSYKYWEIWQTISYEKIVIPPIVHSKVCLQVMGSTKKTKKQYKILLVAPEEAACNIINCCHWCHSVSKLHCQKCRHQVLKGSRLLQHCTSVTLLDSIGIVRNQLSKSIQLEQRYHLLYFTNSYSFLKPGTWITHNALKSRYQITCVWNPKILYTTLTTFWCVKLVRFPFKEVHVKEAFVWSFAGW